MIFNKISLCPLTQDMSCNLGQLSFLKGFVRYGGEIQEILSGKRESRRTIERSLLIPVETCI